MAEAGAGALGQSEQGSGQSEAARWSEEALRLPPSRGSPQSHAHQAALGALGVPVGDCGGDVEEHLEPHLGHLVRRLLEVGAPRGLAAGQELVDEALPDVVPPAARAGQGAGERFVASGTALLLVRTRQDHFRLPVSRLSREGLHHPSTTHILSSWVLTSSTSS